MDATVWRREACETQAGNRRKTNNVIKIRVGEDLFFFKKQFQIHSTVIVFDLAFQVEFFGQHNDCCIQVYEVYKYEMRISHNRWCIRADCAVKIKHCAILLCHNTCQTCKLRNYPSRVRKGNLNEPIGFHMPSWWWQYKAMHLRFLVKATCARFWTYNCSNKKEYVFWAEMARFRETNVLTFKRVILCHSIRDWRLWRILWEKMIHYM